MTPNRVVVAHDGSPAAQEAARVAIQIADAQQMSIHGLYVVDEALALDSYARPEQELGLGREDLSRSDLIAAFERQGSRALEWLEAEAAAAGVPVTTEMLAGGVTELVLREADSAEILALGRRGNTHAASFDSLGRHFLSVAHHAHVPLVVGGTANRPLSRLLVVIDHDDQTQAELSWVARLHQALPVDVVVLVVGGKLQAGSMQAWMSEIKAQRAMSQVPEQRIEVAQVESAEEIAVVADSRDVDLVIMGRYRHRALVEWLLGSTVDRVLRTTPLPVLLV